MRPNKTDHPIGTFRFRFRILGSLGKWDRTEFISKADVPKDILAFAKQLAKKELADNPQKFAILCEASQMRELDLYVFWLKRWARIGYVSAGSFPPGPPPRHSSYDSATFGGSIGI